MPAEEPPAEPRGRWSRLPRWARRVVLSLVCLEVAYVLAFEWSVRSGNLQHWISRRPEKIAISFSSAHSLFPFWVQIEGFRIHGQTPKVRWQAQVDAAAGWISPVALFRRTLRIPWVRASGGEFWLRREEAALSGRLEALPDAAREEILPPLAALAPLPFPRPPSSKPKWSFELPRIRASGLREVWLDGLRLDGSFAASGGFSMFAGREVEVPPGQVEFRDVRATTGDVEIGRGLAGIVEARIARYPFKERRGREALQFISGQADVTGDLADGELLGLFLQRAPWLSFGPTMGQLVAHLEAESGNLQAGSHVEFRHAQLETRVFDFHALGDARVHFEVRPGASAGAEEGAAVTVTYDDFEIRSGDESRAQIVGSGLSLVGTTSHLELGKVLDSTRLAIDLGSARLPDLASFNSWLPPSSGLSLVRGSGVLTGGLDADLAANSAHGEFTATIDGAAVRYRELDLSGSVKLLIRLPAADLAARSFDLAGTRVDLADFRSPQAEAAAPVAAAAGWWAHLTVADGRLVLPPNASAKARFTVNLRDSVPLVGLFETRKNLPGWVENVLSVEDVRAEGALSWTRTETTLDRLATQFRKATIQGRIRFGRESRRGFLMVQWHRLAVGLGFENAAKKWKFVGVRDWYARSDLAGSLAALPADDPLSEAALGQAELGAAGLPKGTVPPDAEFAYEVVPGSVFTGELDGDPEAEVVAVIALPTVAAATALRLAAADLVDGRAVALGSREIRPGSELVALQVEGREVVARFRIPQEGRESGAKPVEETVRWRPVSGATGAADRGPDAP